MDLSVFISVVLRSFLVAAVSALVSIAYVITGHVNKSIGLNNKKGSNDRAHSQQYEDYFYCQSLLNVFKMRDCSFHILTVKNIIYACEVKNKLLKSI